MQATIQYFEKRFFINIKHVLEFHHPSTFLCQTSGRQIIGPYPGSGWICSIAQEEENFYEIDYEVWFPQETEAAAPEVGGELLLAKSPDASHSVSFSENWYPMVIRGNMRNHTDNVANAFWVSYWILTVFYFFLHYFGYSLLIKWLKLKKNKVNNLTKTFFKALPYISICILLLNRDPAPNLKKNLFVATVQWYWLIRQPLFFAVSEPGWGGAGRGNRSCGW